MWTSWLRCKEANADEWGCHTEVTFILSPFSSCRGSRAGPSTHLGNTEPSPHLLFLYVVTSWNYPLSAQQLTCSHSTPGHPIRCAGQPVIRKLICEKGGSLIVRCCSFPPLLFFFSSPSNFIAYQVPFFWLLDDFSCLLWTITNDYQLHSLPCLCFDSLILHGSVTYLLSCS